MTEVHLPQRSHGAGERRPSAAAHADVVFGIAGALVLPVQIVVKLGHGATQLPESRDRGVVLIAGSNLDRSDSGRSTGQLTGLRLSLTQVAPVGMAVAVAPPPRLRHDEDDAGERHGPKAGNSH